MELVNWDYELERMREDIQDQEPLFFCEKCNVSIYEGDTYYETDDYYYLCEDCMEKWLDKLKEDCAKEAEKD